MAEEFKVSIGADVGGLNKGANEVSSILSKLQSKYKELEKELKSNNVASAKLANSIDDLIKDLGDGKISVSKFEMALASLKKQESTLSTENNRLTTSLNKTNKQIKGLGTSMGKAQKGTVNALPSLNEFSRVIQDAPFGIQGVANNITQLTTQFQYLSKNAGGTSAALKAMLTSLSGPAGMLLAISAITSAMVAFGDKVSFSTSRTAGLAKATKEFTTEAMVEVGVIEQLISIAKDEANSKKVRAGAVKKLNDKYPQYLKNLSIESLNTKEVTKSVIALTNSLLLKAQAEGLSALITEKTAKNAEKLNQLALDRKEAVNKEAKLAQSIKEDENARLKAMKEQGRFIEKRDSSNQSRTGASDLLESARNSITNIDNEINNVKNSTAEALKPLKELQKDIEIQILELEPRKTKSGAVTTIFDVDISKAEAKIAKINFALTNISGKERFAEMAKLFKYENDLIEANYKKQVSLAGTNKNALKVAENEKNTALLELKAKFNNDLLSLSKSNIKNELDLIKNSASIEKNAKIKALTDEYSKLGELTQAKSKELANKKKAIEVYANNDSLLKQNEFLNKKLDNENLNGELRVAIEKQIQANLAKIRGEANLKYLKDTATFQSELSALLDPQKNAANFATGLGEALGQGGNVISNIGGAIIDQMAGFLSEMGALLIKYGTLAVLKGKLDLAILAGGIASIGAGVAAIAVGVALTAAGAALGNRSSGESSSSNASSGSDYSSGGSSYSSSSSSASSGTYVFEIQGTKLVGVLKNTLNRNKSLGGNLSFN